MDYIKVWFNYKNGREVKQVLGLNECKKQDKMHLGTKRKYNQKEQELIKYKIVDFFAMIAC